MPEGGAGGLRASPWTGRRRRRPAAALDSLWILRIFLVTFCPHAQSGIAGRVLFPGTACRSSLPALLGWASRRAAQPVPAALVFPGDAAAQLRRSYQARHRVGACGSCLFPAVIYTLHQGGLHRHSLRPARWREPGEGHELSLAGLFRPGAPRLRHEWPPKRKRGATSLHLKTGTTARRLPAAWRGLRRARRGGFFLLVSVGRRVGMLR